MNLENKQIVKVWRGFNWFTIETNGGLLSIRLWSFWFEKTENISIIEELLPSQGGLCYVEVTI